MTARALAVAVTPRSRAWETVRALYELTRPRVLLLVVLTAPPVFVIGRPPQLSVLKAAVILLGIWLVGAACSAFNAWIERDSDRLMTRTRNRPLPSGRLEPAAALAFGAATAIAGLGLLWVAGNALAVLAGAATLAWYVLLYTWVLKRRTAQNIVIGGAAGAAAPLIADAAATGTIRPIAWVLFMVVLLWTPAHFWAIALVRKAEYAAAGIPMMPYVEGDQPTRWRMLGWNLLLVPTSLLPVLSGELGVLYGLTALAGGLAFVWLSIVAIKRKTARSDRRVFAASIVYLLVLFAVAAGDPMLAL